MASEQDQLEEMLRSSVEAQNLNTMRVAAFSELCERMMTEDVSTTVFVRRMAQVADEGSLEANRRGLDSALWLVLARILRESADGFSERSRRA